MTEKDFFERLRQSNYPVVVDFWAPWCGPCKMIDPQLKKLDKEYEGQVEVWKINADEQPQLLRQLHIYGIPTLVSFKDGREVARQTGVAPYPVLAGLFEAAISGETPQPVAISMTWIDRLLRIAVAAALFFLAYLGDFKGIYLLFVGLSGVAFFSAVHDRCPVWQALKPRLTALLNPNRSQE